MRLALKHPLPGDTHALAYCDESFKRERVLADGVDELSEEFGLNPTEKGKKNIEILHHKDRLYQEWVNTKAWEPDTYAILSADRDIFIDFFSRINISSYWDLQKDWKGAGQSYRKVI